jgi:ABC-type bacteriocin/lantibiotic exporter with double-glycine peptidase domain
VRRSRFGPHPRLRLAVLIALAAGCSPFGSSVAFRPESFDRDPNWHHATKFPLISQEGPSDCGAAALSAVLTYWNLPASVDDVRRACPSTPDGIKAGELRTFARDKGLKAFLIEGSRADLENELSKQRPVLVGLALRRGDSVLTHYEVVVGVHRQDQRIVTLDPARGWREWTWENFDQLWQPARRLSLVCFKPAE